MISVYDACQQIRADSKKCPGGYSIPVGSVCGGKEDEKKPPRSGGSVRQDPRRRPGESPRDFLKAKHASPVDKDGRYRPGYPLGSDFTQEVATAFFAENNIPSDRPVPLSSNFAMSDGKGGFPLLGTNSDEERGFREFGQEPLTIQNGDFRNIAKGKARTMIRAIGGPLQASTSKPGRAGMSFVGMGQRDSAFEEQIAEKTAPGKLWTTNAFRKSAGWQWMTSPMETGTVSKSRTSREPVPAILSVTQNLSGAHYYCLDMDTGTSPGVLTIQPDKKDEPKNLVGGYGHLVLGNPVGVIRGSSGQIHPVFDRIQVSPPLTPDQPLVSAQGEPKKKGLTGTQLSLF